MFTLRKMMTIIMSLLALSAVASAMLEPIPVPDNLVTCAGRCGEVSGPPCSCDDKCMLYQNCCENMTLDCPDIWGQGQAEFDKVLRSELICDDSGYYFISSCPQNKAQFETYQDLKEAETITASLDIQSTSLPENATGSGNSDVISGINSDDIKESKTSGNVDISGGQTVGLKTFSVTETLKNAPVTDTAMAITYQNPDILACHGGNLTSAVKWNGLFEIKEREAPASGNIEMTLVYYLPPDNLTSAQLGARCHSIARDYCPAGTDPQLTSLCKGFTSYVHYTYVSKRTVYKNRFCGLCAAINQDDLEPYDHNVRDRRTNEFSILASISGNDLKFSVPSHSDIFKRINWEEATCSLADSPRQDDQEEKKCQVNTCTHTYELRPNGKCRRLNHATISLPVDEFPFTSQQLDCLPEFMKCVFTDVLGREETTTDGSPQVYLDTTFQRLMHVVQLHIYLDFVENVPVDISFKPQNVLRFSAAVKVLKHHVTKCQHGGQLSKSNSGFGLTKLMDKSCKSEAAVSVKPSTNMSEYPEFQTYDLVFWKRPIFEDRGEVQDNAITTFCMFSLPPQQIMADRRVIYCFEDALYKSDKDMMDSFAQLPCLAALDGCQKSGVGRMMSRVGLTVTVALIVMAKMLLSVLQITSCP